MKLQRKLNRALKRNRMRNLSFAAEIYVEDVAKNAEGKDISYLKYVGEGRLGIFELIWTALNITPRELNKKEHKINKRLRAKFKEVSRYKDQDKDARVLNEGTQQVLIEEDEYELLKGLLEAVKFKSALSDEVDTMFEFIDNAPIVRPKLEVMPGEPTS